MASHGAFAESVGAIKQIIILDFLAVISSNATREGVLCRLNTFTLSHCAVLCSDCDLFSGEGKSWCYVLSRFRSINLHTVELDDCHRSLQTKYSVLTSIGNKIF